MSSDQSSTRIDVARLLWEDPEPGRAVRLRASRCDDCGRHEFPASSRCPACGGTNTQVPLSATAQLGQRSQVLHPPPGALLPVPYLVGVANFPEGLSILGLLDAADLESAPVGVAIETVAVEPAPGLVTYAYRPAAEGRPRAT